MAGLQGQTVQSTYDGLLKTVDNQPLNGTLKALTDGEGNQMPMEASTSGIAFNGDVIFTDATVIGLTSGTSGTSGTNGAAGTSGTSGVAGTSGTSGTAGTSGTSGSTGTSGTSGTSGATGAPGTSGTSGTSGINGAPGTSGTSGATGDAGTSGTSGAAGVPGTSGTSGTSGISGTAGTSGTSGAAGAAGTSGTSGTSGAVGTPGTSGTSGTSGAAGTSGTSGAAGTPGTPGTNGTSGTSGTSAGGVAVNNAVNTPTAITVQGYDPSTYMTLNRPIIPGFNIDPMVDFTGSKVVLTPVFLPVGSKVASIKIPFKNVTGSASYSWALYTADSITGAPKNRIDGFVGPGSFLVQPADGNPQFKTLTISTPQTVTNAFMWFAIQNFNADFIGNNVPGIINRSYVPIQQITTFGGDTFGGGIATLYYNAPTYYGTSNWPAVFPANSTDDPFQSRDDNFIIGFGLTA